MMKHYILFIGLTFYHTFALCQNSDGPVYTLQDCIDIALQNNLDYKSADLNVETADVFFRQSKNALLPNINGSYNLGKTSGRSIDPFTNTYSNEELTFSNAGLRLNATVFNGFRLINEWKQQKLNFEAAEMERLEARQNLILNVTLTFLNVMSNRDLLELIANRLESTTQQMNRLKTLFEEEIGNPSEYRDFQGLRANDEANIILTRNNFQDSKLDLKQLMNVDYDFSLAPTNVSENLSGLDTSAQEIYLEALDQFAMVKADELRLDAAAKGVAVARAGYIPEVSIFANLNTNYSSAARIFNEGETRIQETENFVDIDGQTYSVLTEATEFLAEDISYTDQFENNLNQAAGVAIGIPLFNGFRAKNNVKLFKIRKEEAALQLERTKLELRSSIDEAYRDMEAALERFEVYKQQVEAYQESLRINEVRFNNGVNNSVDYIVSKNNYDNALINFNNIKYEVLLRIKILEYYRGNI